MTIDAIIQSTGYHDMLALTLPLNKEAFDSVTVYTKPGDAATIAVCEANNVGYVTTERFTKGGSRFNRGAVYNESFSNLLRLKQALGKRAGWVCIIDSDIVLPPVFRFEVETLPLEEELFYGARRYNVETYEQWLAVQSNADTLKHLTLYRGYGYGYLQLFSMHSTTFRRAWYETGGNPYMEHHDGSTADWVYRNMWGHHVWDPPTQPPDHALDHSVPEPCDPPIGLLRKLPFNVIHLGITGVNATGRHTPLWDRPVPDPSQREGGEGARGTG